jgi:hypothetical protein
MSLNQTGVSGKALLRKGTGREHYYVFLRNDSLALWSTERQEFMHSPTMLHNGEWYSLKIIFTDNITNISLNGSLKMQVPRHLDEQTWNTIAEFKGVTAGETDIYDIKDYNTIAIRSWNTIAEFDHVLTSSVAIDLPKTRLVKYNLLDFTDFTLGTTP